MIDRLVSLAAGVAPELHAHPTTLVEAAAAGGWPATGVWFDPASWTAATTREMRSRLDATGLVPLDIEVVRMGQRDDYGESMIDTAAELGVANVLAISTFEARGETVERMATLCSHAAGAGIRVCLEFMRFTSVRSLADAVQVVEAVDAPNAGILVDLLHARRCGTTDEQIHHTDPHLFPYAQWCDGPAEPPGWDDASLIHDALDLRCPPGDGELDADGFARMFAPTVPFSIEARSQALRDDFPDPVERSRHLLERTRAALGTS